MDKIFWNHTSPELTRRTPVWNHIQLIIKYASNIQQKNFETNKGQIAFDYVVEVSKLQDFSYLGNYWLRLNLFLKQKPNHTFTLLTLRCSDTGEFPLIIDGNYSEDSDFKCSDRGVLESKLEELCIQGFQKMSNAVIKSINHDAHLTRVTTDDSFTIKVPFPPEELINKGESKRAKLWLDEENQIFQEVMYKYREAIQDQKIKNIKKITRQFAYDLKVKYELLRTRSEQAIYEHLTYFDDLLAGVGSIDNYAKKDFKYFGSYKRKDGNIENNPARVWRNKRYRRN